MKKVLAVIAVIVLISALALTLVACSPAGTYKFRSAKYEKFGVSVEYVAGEDAEEDDVILTLNKDGTYEFTSKLPGMTVTEKGTWTKDGDKITFDEDFTATLDGKTLTGEYKGFTLVMSR